MGGGKQFLQGKEFHEIAFLQLVQIYFVLDCGYQDIAMLIFEGF